MGAEKVLAVEIVCIAAVTARMIGGKAERVEVLLRSDTARERIVSLEAGEA